MQPFYHRRELGELGELHISFCSVCFQTVARSTDEADLTDGEEEHECEGLPLGVHFPKIR